MDLIELYEKYIDSSDYPKINVGSTALADGTVNNYKSCIRNAPKYISDSLSIESFKLESTSEVLKRWLSDLNSSALLNTRSEGYRQNIIWVYENYIDFIMTEKYLKYM